jgi:hypothetical protein
MTSELEIWLKQATRQLSSESGAQVRSEIQEHFESARESAMSQGSTMEEAERLAMAALGNAKAANCQYRKVLLTSSEARMLRNAKWEARAVCARPWLKGLLFAMPVTAVFAAAIIYFAGAVALARVLLIGGIGMGLLFMAPFLPIYTPYRGRIFRIAKWAVLAGVLGWAFGPLVRDWSWLLFSCLWPVIWIESTRISIRRKLPVARWPKSLYL